MGRRSLNGPAISLFSFQDIVTSVTAILILLVLILTLELIANKCREAAADPTQTREGLAAAIAELEAVLDRLQKSTPSKPVRVVGQPVAALEREERVLRDQLAWAEDRRDRAEQVQAAAEEMLESAIAALHEQQQAAAEKAEEMAAERNAVEADHAAAVKAATDLDARSEGMERDAEQMRRANAEKRGRLDDRSREIDDLPKPGTELVFRRPANREQEPWLLEVTNEGFAALRLGSGRVERLRPGCGEGSEFRQWAGRLAANRDYVLILARPSGVESAQQARAVLEERRIAFGLDFIGEDQSVHDAASEATIPPHGDGEAQR